MRNVTITLDDNMVKQARVWAAEHDTSVSRLVGDMLAEKLRQEAGYDKAMKRFFASPARRLRQPGEPMPSRESLYDRPSLR